jgi:hypothetical protein
MRMRSPSALSELLAAGMETTANRRPSSGASSRRSRSRDSDGRSSHVCTPRLYDLTLCYASSSPEMNEFPCDAERDALPSHPVAAPARLPGSGAGRAGNANAHQRARWRTRQRHRSGRLE